ncbi:MAG: glycosyltransferase family 39 protein [Deltaproteobacteria bacterium]|nr:glycosyltransferase family 39 protein [Deltaproteobacteria bacterium]
MRLLAAGVVAFVVVLSWPTRARADGLIATGETVAGWRLNRVERHPEYVRYFFSSGEVTTGLEVGATPEQSGPWTTRRHRLMPAPGQEPPTELLTAVMDRLRQYDETTQPPLAKQKTARPQGSDDDRLDRDASWTIPGVPGQAPWPRWQDYPVPLWPLFCVLLGALWAARGRRRSLGAWADRMGAHLKRHPWPWLAVVVAGAAALRLSHLDIPFSIDAMTQRVFFGSLDAGDILAHRYQDQRHPQLFYLILHAFQWLGHGEAITRLPAVLFSLAAAVVLFLLARRELGAGPALVATALLGLNVAFLSHSREVGDLTLFTALTLLSTILVVRALDRPSRGVLGALVIVEAALFYAYYLAILVVLTHGVALFIFGRKRHGKAVALALGGAVVLALPSLCRLYGLVFADRSMRSVAAAFPGHMWGERTTTELLGQLGGLLAPSMEALVVMLVAAVVGALRLGGGRPWRNVVGLVAGLTVVISVTVVGAAVVLVRLKPYYLLFTLPFLLLLITAGCVGPLRQGPDEPSRSAWTLVRDGLGVAVLTYLVGAYAVDLNQRIGAIYEPPDRPRFNDLGATIKAGGSPSVVIGDPNYLHTILLYYGFDDPLTMYRSCHIDDAGGGTQCHRGADQLITLTLLPKMREGWEQESLARLAAARHGRPSWVVYTSRFSNPPLLAQLEQDCEPTGTFGDGGALRLFRCPAPPTDQPEPQ